MSNLTPKQQTLTKARKAARIVGCLLIFGGASALVFGIYTQSLPGLLNGVVLMACSAPMFVVAKIVEKRLDKETHI